MADRNEPASTESPKTGNIIIAKNRGDNVPFPGSATIAKRVIYREDYAVTPAGLKVSVGLAYNPEGSTNVWFVALVAVGPQIWAMKSHGQTKTCANVKLVAGGWYREVATQLKKIQGAGHFITFRPRDAFAVEEAIRKVWPGGIPTDAAQEIPTEHGSARKHTESAEKRAAAERAAQEARRRGAASGVNPPEAVTPSLFD